MDTVTKGMTDMAMVEMEATTQIKDTAAVTEDMAMEDMAAVTEDMAMVTEDMAMEGMAAIMEVMVIIMEDTEVTVVDMAVMAVATEAMETEAMKTMDTAADMADTAVDTEATAVDTEATAVDTVATEDMVDMATKGVMEATEVMTATLEDTEAMTDTTMVVATEDTEEVTTTDTRQVTKAEHTTQQTIKTITVNSSKSGQCRFYSTQTILLFILIIVQYFETKVCTFIHYIGLMRPLNKHHKILL